MPGRACGNQREPRFRSVHPTLGCLTSISRLSSTRRAMNNPVLGTYRKPSDATIGRSSAVCRPRPKERLPRSQMLQNTFFSTGALEQAYEEPLCTRILPGATTQYAAGAQLVGTFKFVTALPPRSEPPTSIMSFQRKFIPSNRIPSLVVETDTDPCGNARTSTPSLRRNPTQPLVRVKRPEVIDMS